MYFFNVGFNAKNNIRLELSFQQGMSAHIFSMDNSQLNKKIKQNLYIYILSFLNPPSNFIFILNSLSTRGWYQL